MDYGSEIRQLRRDVRALRNDIRVIIRTLAIDNVILRHGFVKRLWLRFRRKKK
jgi:hypothetical protein